MVDPWSSQNMQKIKNSREKKIDFGLQKIIMLVENKPIVSKVDLLPKFKENIIYAKGQ